MVHRQIEKLQNMVNNLLGLCAETGAETTQEEADLSSENTQHERLGVMLLQLQDGLLKERYVRRMEKWLLCDKDALRYYVDFQNLTALLHMHFNENKFGKMLDFTKTPSATV